MYNDLFELTIRLLEKSDKSLQQLEFIKEQENYVADFYNEVKPFADEVKEIADYWKEEAYKWIKDEKPKYIHSLQIETTHENLLSISVQAFYQDTKVKRFKDTVQSIIYILEDMKSQIK